MVVIFTDFVDFISEGQDMEDSTSIRFLNQTYNNERIVLLIGKERGDLVSILPLLPSP